MKYKNTLVNFKILLLFFPFLVLSQVKTYTSVKGELVCEKADLEGINIYNLNAKQSSVSRNFGFFTINCSEGDTLMVSSLQFEKTIYVVKYEAIEKKRIYIPLKVQNVALDEIQIELLKKLNSKTLGLISDGKLNYPPIESNLITNSYLDNHIPVLIPSSGMSFPGVSNVIYVKKNQLPRQSKVNKTLLEIEKKELEVEKKEILLKKISEYYKDSYFEKVLKLPRDKVSEFKYYLLDKQEFIAAMDNGNKNLANFLIFEIVEEYKKLN
jgi:hypothetical protein